VHYLVFSQRRPGLAFAGASGGVYRRSGQGQDWTRVFPTGEAWGVTLLPDNLTVLASGEDGYLDVSVDAGDHWRRNAVTTGAIYVASAAPGSPNHLLVGGDGGLYLSMDGGAHWSHPLSLPHSAIAALAWAPGRAPTVFAGAVAGGPTGSNQVYRSQDAGLTWQTYGQGMQSYGGIMSLLVPRRQTVYAGTMGHATWGVSGSNGTWTQLAGGMPPTGDHVAGLAGLPGHPNTLFAATLGHGVFRTDDAGQHWRDISRGLPAARNALIVLAVAYSPLDHALFAGTADGVYELPLGVL
jgi:hypothetical protein